MNAPLSHPPKIDIPDGVTPVMAQFLTAKAAQPDASKTWWIAGSNARVRPRLVNVMPNWQAASIALISVFIVTSAAAPGTPAALSFSSSRSETWTKANSNDT